MSYVTVLASRRQRSSNIRPAPVVTYDALVATFVPNVVSYWKFEVPSGSTVTDVYGTQNATITGSPERNVETIVDFDRLEEGASADGTCIAWPGTVGEYAQVAHNSAHKTLNGTIAITFQCDRLDNKSILLTADVSNPVGGLSIEINTNGSPRAYLRNSAGTPVTVIGASGDVQLSRAYTIFFKWGAGGLSLSLWDDSGFLKRRVLNPLTDGLTSSASAIRMGNYDDRDLNVPHDGPYGRVIWLNRRITDEEETVLARARTIVHDPGPDPEPPPATLEPFACMLRTTGSLVTTWAGMGTFQSSSASARILSPKGNFRYDFRGSILSTSLILPLNGNNWNGTRQLFRFDSGTYQDGSGAACVSGGAFICPNMTADHNWDEIYDSVNTPPSFVIAQNTTADGVLIEGCRCHGGFDGFGFGSGTRDTLKNMTIKKVAFTLMRDDMFENDSWNDGLTVDDCFCEGMIFFSCRNSGFNGSSRINTIRNCVVRNIPIRITNVPNRANLFFKLNSNSVRFDLFNNVFASTQQMYHSGGNPFLELINYNKLRNSSGNTFCWLGSGSWPHPMPAGFTLLEGSAAQTFWNNAKATWWSTFPGTRFSFDPPAP